MKQLNVYINEARNATEQYACETCVKMLKGTKINQDTIKVMLNNLEMKTLKILSNYLEDTDSSGYLPFTPNSDLFNSDNNKSKIIDLISEYLNKKIANI